MIVLYYTLSNSSCRKATKWFETHDINITSKRVSQICKKDLLHALALSNKGFDDILKKRNLSTPLLKKQVNQVHSMSFNEGIDFILKHPELLRVPLIISENKLVLGYNSEDIRVFLSHNHRAVQLLQNKSAC